MDDARSRFVTLSAGELSRSWRIALTACSIFALIAMLTLRLLGPSDLYDQTQPKTISYTTDIIVSGGTHWILPIERGELPATKPPLYNWLAVPGVKWLGFNSEIAHKLPSIAAMLACWLLLVRLGNRLDKARTLGWLASLFFVSNYAIFKLGYLARPDMLLTLWLLIAWVCATRVFVGETRVDEGATASDQRESAVRTSRELHLTTLARPTRWRSLAVAPGNANFAIAFWLAVTLAAMTKGPAALVVVIFAIIAARIIAGRFSAIRLLHPVIGSLFAAIVFGAWVFAVWRINPDHLHEELWFNEIYGRITGTGREGTDHGTREFLRETPYQLFYFITRFAPWSVLTVMAIVAMCARRGGDQGVPRPASDSESAVRTSEIVNLHTLARPTPVGRWPWHPSLPHDAVELPWMRSAALFVVLTVGLFSLSVGKRADYVAIAIPQASLLAAWAMLRVRPRIALQLPWLAPLGAAITLAALSYYDHKQIWAPQPGFGNAIRAFVDASTDAIAAEPGVVLNASAGGTYMQAALGIVEGDQRRAVSETITHSKPFWVVAGRTQNAPFEFDKWLQQRRFAARTEAIVRSAELPRADGWPGPVTLWRVTPE